MKPVVSAAAALLAIASPAARACSSCGCTLNSDWSSQGYTTHSGVHLDVRYDYFDQSDLRSGGGSVARGSLSVPSGQEVQQRTLNRNLMLGLDYSPNRAFGVSVLVPYFDRPHTTIAAGDTGISGSHSRGLGDVRVVGRYQGFEHDLSWGVQFGLKLPTGRIDDRFASGPQAGAIVDRGLQPGTGTTDLLVGAYSVGYLGAGVAYFGTVLWQQPLASRDAFRPGPGVNLSLGLRYTRPLPAGLVPQLQLNARIEGRESGANADAGNSGATLVYLSPGIGFKAGASTDVFAFVQAPVYQRVNGLQLEPRVSVSVGVRYRF
jgi:hypothetical protein